MMVKHSLVLATLLLGLSSAAQATVTQPNGLVVPRDSMNGEIQVYTVLAQRDPLLNWQTDSDTRPEVFSPLCSFTAELLLKETGSDLAVGWYNVDPNATVAPTTAQIYTVIPIGAKAGAMVTGQSIKDDPRYTGGLIGFALIGSAGFQTHYSERKWNVQCTGNTCTTPGPWITSITYISKSIPNAFFLGFEDGSLGANSFGNDGDYNDYFFLFTGLTCQGGGKPCTVPGAMGICASGVTQCITGGTSCKQVLQPEAVEKCDGLDNNCNGMIDEGATCPDGQVCDRGRCATSCSNEFPCADGLTCDSGRCVDTACTGVSCSTGMICKLGSCVDPCTGVVCPGVQICRVGRCVDACSGVSCPSGQVCQGGACVTGCNCYPCGDPALGCSLSTNLCVATACVNVSCGPGDVCQAGVCTSSCQGAICPSGQVCTQGNCVDMTSTDPGTGTDPNGDGTDPGGNVATGCACRLSPTGDTPGAVALTATLFVLAFSILRRRRLA